MIVSNEVFCSCDFFNPKLFFIFLQNGYGDSYERGGNPRTGYYCFAINTNTTIILLQIKQKEEENLSGNVIIKAKENKGRFYAILP